MSLGPKMASSSSTPSVSLSLRLSFLSLSYSEEVKWGMDEGSITPTPPSDHRAEQRLQLHPLAAATLSKCQTEEQTNPGSAGTAPTPGQPDGGPPSVLKAKAVTQHASVQSSHLCTL